MIGKKIFAGANSNLLILILYIPSLYLIYKICFFLGIVDVDFNAANLLQWDTKWYHSIKEEGYQFYRDKQSNLAFFPLFSYMWRLFHVSIEVICFINAIIFGLTIWLFSKNFRVNKQKFWMLMSTPAFVFCFIPYSESLYMLGVTLLLIGISKQKLVWVFLACLVIGLTRSVVVFFIPAGVITVLYYFKAKRSVFKVVMVLFASTILSFVIVQIWQYLVTGEWFTFFKAQRHWEHYFRLPQHLITSWWRETLWEDMRAMAIALCFAIIAVIYLWRKFNKKISEDLSPEVLFSLLNIAAVGLFILLFQGGDFHSLNRYVFCAPFLWLVAINIRRLEVKLPIWFWYAMMGLLFLLCINGPLNPDFSPAKFLNYMIFVALLYFRWMFWVVDKFPRWFFIVLLAVGFLFQLHFLHMFLSGKWIG